MNANDVVILYKQKQELEKRLKEIKQQLGRVARSVSEGGETRVGQLKVIHRPYARRAEGETFKHIERLEDLGMGDWTWRGMDSGGVAKTMKEDMDIPELTEWEGLIWEERYWLQATRYGKRKGS